MGALKLVSEQETKRLELMAKAKAAVPLLNDVDELADDGRQAMLKGLAVNGGGRLQGIDLPAELVAELTKSLRQSSRQEEIQGVYDVTLVDPAFHDGFRVRLQDVGTGEEFYAALRDRLVSENDYLAIQTAVWNKTPVRLKLRGRRLRGKIVEAVILDAAAAAPPTS